MFSFSLLFAVCLFRGFGVSAYCGKQICDETGFLTEKDGEKLQSEICTWENIMYTLPSSCWKSKCGNNWKTGFIITKLDIGNPAMTTGILRSCYDINILLYTLQQSECPEQVKLEFSLPSSPQPQTTQTPSSSTLSNIMSEMLKLFYGETVEKSFIKTKLLDSRFEAKHNCTYTRGILPSNRITMMDPTSTPTWNTNYTNASDSNLTRHSHGGHGGIFEAILYIVCFMCGSSALSLLFCFRRVRHCICTICGLCRDTENLLHHVDID